CGGTGDTALGELFHARAVAQVARHFVEGGELNGVEAGFNCLGGHLGEAFGRAGIGRAVDVGVIADARLDAAAEQVVGGDAMDFTADVPQAVFERAGGDGGGRMAA